MNENSSKPAKNNKTVKGKAIIVPSTHWDREDMGSHANFQLFYLLIVSAATCMMTVAFDLVWIIEFVTSAITFDVIPMKDHPPLMSLIRSTLGLGTWLATCTVLALTVRVVFGEEGSKNIVRRNKLTTLLAGALIAAVPGIIVGAVVNYVINIATIPMMNTINENVQTGIGYGNIIDYIIKTALYNSTSSLITILVTTGTIFYLNRPLTKITLHPLHEGVRKRVLVSLMITSAVIIINYIPFEFFNALTRQAYDGFTIEVYEIYYVTMKVVQLILFLLLFIVMQRTIDNTANRIHRYGVENSRVARSRPVTSTVGTLMIAGVIGAAAGKVVDLVFVVMTSYPAELEYLFHPYVWIYQGMDIISSPLLPVIVVLTAFLNPYGEKIR
ncbi:MAG: hypothetical protein ACFFD4_09285 [Candidatus Odinarchaeota archaeon]